MAPPTRNLPARPTGTIESPDFESLLSSQKSSKSKKIFSLPTSKEEAELFIATSFSRLRSSEMPYIINKISNFRGIDGPDIFLESQDGNFFLELMEIRPWHGPYVKGPRIFNTGYYVDWIRRQIEIKKRKYKQRNYFPICLLLYVSDERAMPTPEALEHVERDIKLIGDFPFLNIFLIIFNADGKCGIRNLSQPWFAFSHLDYFEIRTQELIQPRTEDIRITRLSDSKDGNKNFNMRIYLPKGADGNQFFLRSKQQRFLKIF